MPLIQSHGAAAVVTMDTDMDTSVGDRLVRTRIPNDVERGGQTGSQHRCSKKSNDVRLKASLIKHLRLFACVLSLRCNFRVSSHHVCLPFSIKYCRFLVLIQIQQRA